MKDDWPLPAYASIQPARVAVLEDDRKLRQEILLPALYSYGFITHGAASAAELYRLMLSQRFDILVLGIGLPNEDGFAVAQHLRAISSIGIVMLTGLDDRLQHIRALRSGADAYLAKPIDLEVLAAMLHSLVRRMTPSAPSRTLSDRPPTPRWRLEAGGWRLVSPAGRIVTLTSIEQCVLTALATGSERPVTREALIQALNHDVYTFDPHRLEMIIHRLRRKIVAQAGERLPLQTVRGKGYMLACDVLPPTQPLPPEHAQ